jgi:prepilin-type processing-associated H-X9-DG protein
LERSDPKVILARAKDDWRAHNSRNHSGEGQTVLFVDGHADYFSTPLAGIDGENLYTLATSAADAASKLIGLVPIPSEPLGPLTSTDSFIVP